jgi:hypothetical protein
VSSSLSVSLGTELGKCFWEAMRRAVTERERVLAVTERERVLFVGT